MIFSSLVFAAFLAVLLALMAVVRRDYGRKVLLLAAGMFFYGFWDWRFLALIGFTSVFDYYMALRIAEAQGRRRLRLLVLDIVVNLLLLVVFKYLGFMITNLNLVVAPLGVRLPVATLPIPIGISFFVFEAMSYCIDVYRGRIEPYRNWMHFGLFIFFFPRMIAGPIIRAADFLPQVAGRALRFTNENVNRAGCLFLLGLLKKVVIADRLAQLADPVFANPQAFDSATVWAAVVAYSFQIFCDFSGYTDMAIGLAKLFGIDLPLNFNLPYLAANITDFWRRWHISLSTWLRDYLYIPLGGSRRGPSRTYLNLIITMLLGGLWHGASWNFVVWGGLHGLALAVHKAIGGTVETRGGSLRRSLSVAATFLFVTVAWVPFRAPSFSATAATLAKLAFIGGPGVRWIYTPFWPLAAAVVAWHLGRRAHGEHAEIPLMSWGGWLVIWCVVYLIAFASPLHASPFIYFQF